MSARCRTPTPASPSTAALTGALCSTRQPSRPRRGWRRVRRARLLDARLEALAAGDGSTRRRRRGFVGRDRLMCARGCAAGARPARLHPALAGLRALQAAVERDHQRRAHRAVALGADLCEKLLREFDELDLFTPPDSGDALPAAALLAVLGYREDELTPYVYFLKEGVREVRGGYEHVASSQYVFIMTRFYSGSTEVHTLPTSFPALTLFALLCHGMRRAPSSRFWAVIERLIRRLSRASPAGSCHTGRRLRFLEATGRRRTWRSPCSPCGPIVMKSGISRMNEKRIAESDVVKMKMPSALKKEDAKEQRRGGDDGGDRAAMTEMPTPERLALLVPRARRLVVEVCEVDGVVNRHADRRW